MLVYQIGEERVMLGEDGQPLPLPDPDVIDAEVLEEGTPGDWAKCLIPVMLMIAGYQVVYN